VAVVEILVVATEVAREVVKVLVKVAVETGVVMVVEVTGEEPVAAGLAGVALDSDLVVVPAEEVDPVVALEEVDQEEVADLAVETAVVAAILH
jgi:hypothetical protein